MRHKIWVCPTCKGRYRNSTDAYNCKRNHQIFAELWWECDKCRFGIRIDNRTENSIAAEIKQHKDIYCAGTKYDLWRNTDEN